MITFNKNRCFICGACVESCPTHALKFSDKDKMFSYPQFDSSLCKSCNLCESVCPLNNSISIDKQMYYAFKAPLEIRKKSTSGGAFYFLAKKALEKHFHIFGAYLNDNNEVIYREIQKEDELHFLLGTKYVEANKENVFKRISKLLNQGEKVLFVGEACSIHGLKLFVSNNSNLLTIDHVCNGVPSLKLWKSYINYLSLKGNITDFIFRDKIRPNDGHTVTYKINNELVHENFLDNKWCRIYSKSLGLRPSCYQCPYANLKRVSDITLADFWGIEKVDKSFNDGYGVSLIITSSLFGDSFVKDILPLGEYKIVKKEECLQPRLITSIKEPFLNKFFVKDVLNHDLNNELIELLIKKYGS